MSRISIPDVSEATGAAAEIFARVKKAAGSVPNLFATIGSLQPAVLEAYLDADAVLAKSALDRKDRETINLVASAATGCDYCLAAHSMLAKMAGLPADAIINLRSGKSTGDARRDALASFVHLVVTTRGTLGQDDFAAIKRAGYSDRQLIEISLAIALILFTNTVNRINDTTLDFPPVT